MKFKLSDYSNAAEVVAAAAVVINGMRGTIDMSIEEEYQYLMMMNAIFIGFQNSDLLVEEGTLDPSASESITTAILGVKDLPGFERPWRQRKGGPLQWLRRERGSASRAPDQRVRGYLSARKKAGCP